ncbi:MAG: hypothetical protein EBT63_05670 [Proteobacteria bacterium]|nr:hypothetical protein [Pseudomonadota bacterium]NCA28575.1 hypothetical protein [Pseudomonadota bacterium]
MNKKHLFLTIFLVFVFLSNESKSAQQIQEVNYFASLRANQTNVRSGPGSNYPIKYSFKTKNLPIKVVSEYDNWCEIEDYEGTKGWIAQNLITKKRHVLTYSKKNIVGMHVKKDPNSRKVFNIENFVIGELLKCENSWCAVKVNDKKGWIHSQDLFGVDNLDLQ